MDNLERQLQPDSQKQPFGPHQLAWIKSWIIDNNFRDKEDGPMIKPITFTRCRATQ